MKPNLFNVLKSQALNSNRWDSVVLIQQEQFWTLGGGICSRQHLVDMRVTQQPGLDLM